MKDNYEILSDYWCYNYFNDFEKYLNTQGETYNFKDKALEYLDNKGNSNITIALLCIDAGRLIDDLFDMIQDKK